MPAFLGLFLEAEYGMLFTPNSSLEADVVEILENRYPVSQISEYFKFQIIYSLRVAKSSSRVRISIFINKKEYEIVGHSSFN